MRATTVISNKVHVVQFFLSILRELLQEHRMHELQQCCQITNKFLYNFDIISGNECWQTRNLLLEHSYQNFTHKFSHMKMWCLIYICACKAWLVRQGILLNIRDGTGCRGRQLTGSEMSGSDMSDIIVRQWNVR